MTADRDDAACTGAVVRKPPMKETALGERVAVPRALIHRGLTLAAAVICEHNFCVMARTSLAVENSLGIMCNFKELRVAKITHISTSALGARLQALYRIGRTDISEFKLLTPSGENCFRSRLYTSLAVIAASPIAPVRFLMQMSARNALGVRCVFDGRSHDRPAQRSSGLRMHLGPSPPSNIRRSIAPSVVKHDHASRRSALPR